MGIRLKRGKRREMILDAATELFRRQGYRATGIDDIGEAVGITGPAVYRHFESKDKLLAAVLERHIDRYQAMVSEVAATDLPPDEALRTLMESVVERALAYEDLTTIFVREMYNLPKEDLVRLERRQRLLVTECVHLIRQVRPALSDEEARISILAVGNMIESINNFKTGMSRERLRERLVSMAMAAIMA